MSRTFFPLACISALFLNAISVINAASQVNTSDNHIDAQVVSEYSLIPERLRELKTDCRMNELKIPGNVRTTLKQWNPEFSVWNSSDYSISACLDELFRPSSSLNLNLGIGDFNGDGKLDYVIAGHDKKEESLIVVLSTGDAKFEVAPICVSPGSGTKLVTDCGLLYSRNLGSRPNIAVYMVLPKGTWFSGSTGEDSGGASFKIKRDAFIVARVDHKFGTVEKNGFQHQSPFASRLLFRWVGHNDKLYMEYQRSAPELYSKLEFVAYFACAVRFRGKGEESFPADTEGY
ncbi:MAG: VCBS repeat-containing protein [Elusimicrobia bacterium]|nr:VCBS repeat-containing protein [Elusimicrobiota bacterium]